MIHRAARFAALTLSLSLAAPAALAHEFWIEPSAYRPAVGSTVDLTLFIGHHFDSERFPRTSARIERFVAVGPEGEGDVGGVEGKSPAGHLHIADPGAYVVAYRGTPKLTELEAQKFEGYLREKGLVEAIAARAAAGTSSAPGRELFSRCAKTLLVTPGWSGSPVDRAVGMRLELVAQNNPFELAPGQAIDLLLLFESAPAAGRLVIAELPGHPDALVSARTGPDGRASLTLSKPGPWLISAVHMITAPAGTNAEWESLWASLTFELPPSR